MAYSAPAFGSIPPTGSGVDPAVDSGVAREGNSKASSNAP